MIRKPNNGLHSGKLPNPISSLNPLKQVLQAGWRYLYVHYRNNSHQFLYDIAASGAVIGATFNFK